MKITFEVDAPGAIELTLDPDGRESLMKLLADLRVGDHEHLMTPSWGGDRLTEDFPNPDLTPIHKVTITLEEATGATS